MVDIRVKNGASLRHERVMTMISFIELHSPEGTKLLDIQSYMLQTYGLKFTTTTEYLKECHLAGMITPREGGWVVSDRYKKFRK